MSLAHDPSEATIHHHSLLQEFQSLLNIVVVALFIMAFIAQPFRIPSASMEPTLLVGDFLLVNKEISTGRFPALAPANLIRRGDLSSFITRSIPRCIWSSASSVCRATGCACATAAC
jgi:signal peptidase I